MAAAIPFFGSNRMSATLTCPDTNEDTFARRLGFVCFDDLVQMSEPLAAQDGGLWFLTGISDHCWLAWPCPVPAYDASQRFDSYEDARDFVTQCAHMLHVLSPGVRNSRERPRRLSSAASAPSDVPHPHVSWFRLWR
jgi:hypothetical protein